jgi:glutamate/tyrosine decarboxylase-like PLP-dependent enzyme
MTNDDYTKYDLGEGDICPDCQNSVKWDESRSVWLHVDSVSGCYLALTNEGKGK